MSSTAARGAVGLALVAIACSKQSSPGPTSESLGHDGAASAGEGRHGDAAAARPSSDAMTETGSFEPSESDASDATVLGDARAAVRDDASAAVRDDARDASDEPLARATADSGSGPRPDVSFGDAALPRADDGGVEELVHFFGRWSLVGSRATTVNSGSHVVARFEGTALRARFDLATNQPGLPTVTWKIDQQPWQESEIAASLPLAEGLAAGEHDITLMARGLDELQSRWSPPLVSSITFLGFEVTDGSLRSSPRPLRPKLEFLGDSITEGVRMFDDRPGKTGNPWRADGRLAYAAQTALDLDAEWRQVGFGRQGLTIGGNGGVPPAGAAFDWIYAGVPRDGWQADVVIINQGTNDGASASATFRPLYASYLATVRAGYRAAAILAMRPFNGAHQDDIRAEVAARNAAGDGNTFYIDTTGWLAAAAGDFTDGVHPNPQGSLKAKTLLVAEVRKHL